MPESPLSQGQVDEWRRENALLVAGFLDTMDLSESLDTEFSAIYEQTPIAKMLEKPAADDQPESARFHIDQLLAIRPLPGYTTPQLNLLMLHPKVLAAVQQLLDTPDIYLYLSYVWTKSTGQTDFAQPFHLDYPTHQLTVPPENPAHGTVNLFVYLTDVTDDLGALHYVPGSAATEFPLFRAQPAPDAQQRLGQREKSAAGPRGTVIFYNTRLYHRGTNLTRPEGLRNVIGLGFRRADMPWVAPGRGEFHPMMPQWSELFCAASVEQLAALGVPRPGHPYWTAYTIAGTEARYPTWNSSPWRSAAGLAAKPGDTPKLEWPSLEDVI